MFEFIYRNPNHWDIYQKTRNGSFRAAKIRGESNDISLRGEGKEGGLFYCVSMTFPSLESCMAYVCATMIEYTKNNP